MGLTERIDRFQRRHTAVGYPLAVVYKFFDDQGPYLTAMITYYAFLSLFPLLLLLTSVLGFLLHNDPELQDRVLDSAVSRVPVLGHQLIDNVHSLRGSTVAVVVGVLVGLYGSLGVVQAAQNAFNKVWAVPRAERPNPFTARLRSLAMLVVLGIGVVVSIGLSALSSVADHVGSSEIGAGLRVLFALAAVVLNASLLLFAFRLLTARRVGTAGLLPGALTAAILWQILQSGGAYYFGTTLRHSSATYGLFAVVLGLLAWLYLSALAVVLGAELNSVLVRRLWPRSLLTPFTDDVQLTRGDRKAYASYAQTEQHKGFETVDVDFDQPAPEGSERTPDESQPAPDDRERTPDESQPAPDDRERTSEESRPAPDGS